MNRMIFILATIALFWTAGPAHADVGRLMAAPLAETAGEGDAFLIVWPEPEIRSNALEGVEDLYDECVQSILSQLETLGVFRMKSDRIRRYRQEHDDLLHGHMSEEAVRIFRREGVRYLLYGYAYQAPEGVLERRREIPVLVLKIYDFEERRLASVGVFRLGSLRRQDFAVVRTGNGAADRSPLWLIRSPEEDQVKGRFLADLFHSLQLSRNPHAQVEDASLWEQGAGSGEGSIARGPRGEVALIPAFLESGAYLCGKARVPGTEYHRPFVLYRIAGDRDNSLIQVASEAVLQLRRNHIGGSPAQETNIEILLPALEKIWPYSARDVEELIGFYLAEHGVGMAVDSNAHHTLELERLQLEGYSEAPTGGMPVPRVGCDMSLRDSHNARISFASRAIELEDYGRGVLLEAQVFEECVRRRFNAVFRVWPYEDVVRFMDRVGRTSRKVLNPNRVDALLGEWEIRLAEVGIEHAFRMGLERIREYLEEGRIQDANHLRMDWKQKIQSSRDLNAGKRRELLDLLHDLDGAGSW